MFKLICHGTIKLDNIELSIPIARVLGMKKLEILSYLQTHYDVWCYTEGRQFVEGSIKRSKVVIRKIKAVKKLPIKYFKNDELKNDNLKNDH
jgi:hypothetical protein